MVGVQGLDGLNGLARQRDPIERSVVPEPLEAVVLNFAAHRQDTEPFATIGIAAALGPDNLTVKIEHDQVTRLAIYRH